MMTFRILKIGLAVLSVFCLLDVLYGYYHDHIFVNRKGYNKAILVLKIFSL